MKETFEQPREPDIKRKLRVFFEACSWREIDPWGDEDFRGMCGRYKVTENDIRAFTAELRQEHMDKVRKEAETEDRRKRTRHLKY